MGRRKTSRISVIVAVLPHILATPFLLVAIEKASIKTLRT